METSLYDSLFEIPFKAVKNIEDINYVPPAYLIPRWEECFAMAFLKRISNEYEDIELHDLQDKDRNSMDLFCPKSQVGIEVTQAINPKYRKEESNWNKPLCNGKDGEIEHIWKNTPTSFSIIEHSIIEKIGKYQSYKDRYNPKDIDLFVYIVDARVKSDNGYIKGFHVPLPLGYSAFQDLGNGLKEMINKTNNLYRKTYLVFMNYWYVYENSTICNNILRESFLEEIYSDTEGLQSCLNK